MPKNVLLVWELFWEPDFLPNGSKLLSVRFLKIRWWVRFPPQKYPISFENPRKPYVLRLSIFLFIFILLIFRELMGTNHLFFASGNYFLGTPVSVMGVINHLLENDPKSYRGLGNLFFKMAGPTKNVKLRLRFFVLPHLDFFCLLNSVCVALFHQLLALQS